MMVDQAAVIDALYVARKNGSQPSGLAQVQLELEEALEMQLRVLGRFEAEGEKLGGWKVGLTSGNARDRMGKDFRPFGYVLQSRIFPSGATVPVAKIVNCAIEPELCLIIGSPLRGDAVGVTEAKAAVRAVAPAFEINQRRVGSDAGQALLLADGLAQWGIVVGPEAPVCDSLVETIVEFYCDEQLVETKPQGRRWMIPTCHCRVFASSCTNTGSAWSQGSRLLRGRFVITWSVSRAHTAPFFPALAPCRCSLSE